MSWNAPIPAETLHRTLTRALGAAQVAVKLDASDHDTNAIVDAYQRCIFLLDDVLRREPSEEETERLTAIRSSYRDRIQVLLLCRSVPVAQQSTETLIEQVKPWRFQGGKARRWTLERLKVLCGCTNSVVIG
ncbi:hypothetical protein DFH09DRAFT_562914 [Mycena vulgaris]|nr:hypothetical protein DFH09DRAFT_562914 [Mycena vulgaris]